MPPARLQLVPVVTSSSFYRTSPPAENLCVCPWTWLMRFGCRGMLMSQLALKFFCRVASSTQLQRCRSVRSSGLKKFQTDQMRFENFQNGLGRIEGGNRWIDGLIRIDSKRVTALLSNNRIKYAFKQK